MELSNPDSYTTLSNHSTYSDDEFASDDLEILDDHKKTRNRNNHNFKLTAESESDQEDDFVDDDDDDDDDEEQRINDELLKEPLTAEERTLYTLNGLSVTVEIGRVKSEHPRCTINISSWSLFSVMTAFDNCCERFGMDRKDFVLYLKWKNQTSPYCIAWEDIISLNIPYNRSGFKIFLKRKPNKKNTSNSRKQRWDKEEVVEDVHNKKKQKFSKNALKNLANRNDLKQVRDLLSNKHILYINDHKKKKSIWTRLVHLYVCTSLF